MVRGAQDQTVSSATAADSAIDMREIKTYLESIGLLTGAERPLHPGMLRPRPLYDMERPTSPSSRPRSRHGSPPMGSARVRPKSAGVRGLPPRASSTTPGIYAATAATDVDGGRPSDPMPLLQRRPVSASTGRRPHTAGSAGRERTRERHEDPPHQLSTKALMELGFSPYWGDDSSPSKIHAAVPVVPRKLHKKAAAVEVPASLRELKAMMPRQRGDILPRLEDDPFRDRIGEDLRIYYEEKTRELHTSLRDWSGELEQRRQLYNKPPPSSPKPKKTSKPKAKRRAKSPQVRFMVGEAQVATIHEPDPQQHSDVSVDAIAAGTDNNVGEVTRETGGDRPTATTAPGDVEESEVKDKNDDADEDGDGDTDLHSETGDEGELAPYMEAKFVLKWFNQDVVNMLCSHLASGERRAELSMKNRRAAAAAPKRSQSFHRGSSLSFLRPAASLRDLSSASATLHEEQEQEHEGGGEAPSRVDAEAFTPQRRTLRSPSGLWGGVVYGQASRSSRALLVEVHSPVKYWG